MKSITRGHQVHMRAKQESFKLELLRQKARFRVGRTMFRVAKVMLKGLLHGLDEVWYWMFFAEVKRHRAPGVMEQRHEFEAVKGQQAQHLGRMM